jgi:hypothetical protein
LRYDSAGQHSLKEFQPMRISMSLATVLFVLVIASAQADEHFTTRLRAGAGADVCRCSTSGEGKSSVMGAWFSSIPITFQYAHCFRHPFPYNKTSRWSPQKSNLAPNKF